MKIKHVYYILTALVAITFLSCSTSSEKQQEEVSTEVRKKENIFVTKEQFRQSNMTLGQIKDSLLANTIVLNGSIQNPPGNIMSISPLIGGIVKNLKVIRGQHVKKRQLLFQLENIEFIKLQKEYLTLKEQIVLLKAELERKEKLAKNNVASQKSLQLAENNYKKANIELVSIEKILRAIHVNTASLNELNITAIISFYAPFDGYVDEVFITNGKFLDPNDIAMNVVNTEHMHLELNAYESDAAHIKEKQKLTFYFTSNPGIRYDGEVFALAKSIDPQSRTVAIHGHIDSELQNMIVGMHAVAEVYTEKSLQHILPESAVVNVEDKYFILQLIDNTDGYHFKKIEVKIKSREKDIFSIIKNDSLDFNTTYLTKGAFDLISE